MTTKLELLIRMNTLKSVEVWLHEQYLEIDKEMRDIEASGE